MPYQFPDIAHSPMTNSDANYLAGVYGFPSLSALADSLPPNARVADFGSGLSNLANQLAELRPDITLYAIDIQYDRPLIQDAEALGALISAAPPNVQYIWGNILRDSSLERLGQFDRAFCYNLVSHHLRVRHAGRVLARTALTNMLHTLTPEGTLEIGPSNKHMQNSRRWGTITVPAAALGDSRAIEADLDMLTSPRLSNILYTAAAIGGASLYPRSRFTHHEHGKHMPVRPPVVWSADAGRTQHEVYSWRSPLYLAKFAWGLIAATITTR